MIRKSSFFLLRSQNQTIPKPNDGICRVRGCVIHISQFPFWWYGIQTPFCVFSLQSRRRSTRGSRGCTRARGRPSLSTVKSASSAARASTAATTEGSVRFLSLFGYYLARELKFRLREHTSCLCSAAALAVCFKGRMAGQDARETGNEFSQLKF